MVEYDLGKIATRVRFPQVALVLQDRDSGSLHCLQPACYIYHMKSSLKPKFACRAKNPANCRYHGAFQQLEKALEANNYVAYEIAKEKILAAQKQAKLYRTVEGRTNLPVQKVPIWNPNPGCVCDRDEIKRGCAVHDPENACPQCGGLGYRHNVRLIKGVTNVTKEDCPNCDSTGYLISWPDLP
jgi:hypothetical protein